MATTMHAINCDWPTKPVPPFASGRAGIGLVSAIGAEGKVHAATQLQPLSAINDTLDRRACGPAGMRACGKVPFRFVLDHAS